MLNPEKVSFPDGYDFADPFGEYSATYEGVTREFSIQRVNLGEQLDPYYLITVYLAKSPDQLNLQDYLGFFNRDSQPSRPTIKFLPEMGQFGAIEYLYPDYDSDYSLALVDIIVKGQVMQLTNLEQGVLAYRSTAPALLEDEAIS